MVLGAEGMPAFEPRSYEETSCMGNSVEEWHRYAQRSRERGQSAVFSLAGVPKEYPKSSLGPRGGDVGAPQVDAP